MVQEVREEFLGCDSKDEQTVLTVLIIYRCGEVCFQFSVLDELNSRKKEGIEKYCAVERRTICHDQICTKLAVTNEGRKAYSIRIIVSWVSSVTLDSKSKPSSRGVTNEARVMRKK